LLIDAIDKKSQYEWSALIVPDHFLGTFDKFLECFHMIQKDPMQKQLASLEVARFSEESSPEKAAEAQEVVSI
jgi:hypothetical protein